MADAHGYVVVADGHGYVVVASARVGSDRTVGSVGGDAPDHGTMAVRPLNAPIVAASG